MTCLKTGIKCGTFLHGALPLQFRPFGAIRGAFLVRAANFNPTLARVAAWIRPPNTISRQRGELGDTQRCPEVIAGIVIRMDKQGSQSLCCDYAAAESGGTDLLE